MNAAAVSIIEAKTGCTSVQAHEVIDELIAKGWRPPESTCVATEGLPLEGAKSATPTVKASSGGLLVAHTDGACSGNPGPGGWAVVYSQGGVLIGELSGGSPATTNNRMELVAIQEALRQAPEGVDLQIITDSQNAIGWLSKGWKRKDPAIAALCQEIDQLMAARSCTFSHVLGHNGDVLNERADRLAVLAIPKTDAAGRSRTGR